jgi:hypothetical protein
VRSWRWGQQQEVATVTSRARTVAQRLAACLGQRGNAAGQSRTLDWRVTGGTWDLSACHRPCEDVVRRYAHRHWFCGGAGHAARVLHVGERLAVARVGG